MGALEMEETLDSWNDDRLDELSRRMDEGFKEMREGFARVDREMKEGFARVDKRFERIDERFERIDERFERIDQRFERLLHNLVVIAWSFSGAVVAALASLIAVQV
jgi:predicted nuclease with TOPRIM domain